MTPHREISLIFVNDTPYRVWTGDPSFQAEDFIRSFDPCHHLQMARLLEPGLSSESPDPASLGIRTIHGLASEALFALLFSVLQAPDAPAAWVLLYRPGDLEKMIRRVEAGEQIPARFELAKISWHEIAKTLIPITESDIPGAASVVENFGNFWARLAADFVSDLAKKEFNSLKHGLRAQAACPFFSLGGYQVPAADHGTAFPYLNRQNGEIVLSIALRSWSAKCLLSQLDLISASLTNLLALLKQLHGIEEHLALEIPGSDAFESAQPPKSQVLSALALTTNWPETSRVKPLDKEKALDDYLQLGRFRIFRR